MPAPGFLEVDLDLNVLDTFSISGINTIDEYLKTDKGTIG